MLRSHFASLPSLRLTALRKKCGLLPNLVPDARSSVTVEFDVAAEPIPIDSQHQTKVAGSREVRDNLVKKPSAAVHLTPPPGIIS